jgi:Protein of unknown function (DUF3341)
MSATETAKPTKGPREPRFFGYVAEYATPAEVVHAAEKVRDAGYSKWDCLTPFPVHGLDRAMGMKRTILPWIVLGGGLTGLGIAIFMQWYVNSPHTQSAALYILSGYPLNISGKPYWSLPPNVPVMFELAVLIAALTTFFFVWALSGLPRFYHPVFNAARFRRATDDKFFLLIEAADLKFDLQESLALLESTHPAAIEEVRD